MELSNFARMLLVGTIHFEDRFCASKKGGMRGCAVSARGAVHMAAALAGCRKALVGTGWTISHLFSTNRLRNHSPPLVGIPFLDLLASIRSGGAHADRRALNHWKHTKKWVWLGSWTQRNCVSVVKAWVGKILCAPYVSTEMIAQGMMSCDCG